jgi:hypothetical protein
MTIRQQGGIFGRNPTFNDVDVEGTLTIGGAPVPAPANTLVSSDIGVTVQGYDADTAKYDDVTANFTGTLQNSGSNVVVDTDIGSTVQAYDAATAKTNVSQTFTALQDFNFAGGGNYVATFQTTTTATPYTVNVGEGSGAADGYPLFRVGQSYAPYTDYFRVDSGTSNITVGKSLAMANGKGIDFSATSGTGTSELFSDYEEGNWTPTLTDASNNATMGASNSGTYTKIGRFVNCQMYIETTSLGSVSGAVYITGWPFTITKSGGGSLSAASGLNITAGRVVVLRPWSAALMRIEQWSATTGTDSFTASNWSADGAAYISVTYTV